MKRIVVFLLVIALCIPALFSCALFNNPMAEVADKYAVSEPTKVVAYTTQKVGGIELKSDYELITGYVDNAAASLYISNSQEIRSVDEGGQNAEIYDIIKSVTTKIEAIEGKGTRTNGGDWNPNGEVWKVGRGKMALNLDKSAVNNVNYENNVLTFVVPKDNVAVVLGETYAADVGSDVEITIVDDGAVVTSVELHYFLNAKEDANVVASEMNIKVIYTYDIERIIIE